MPHSTAPASTPFNNDQGHFLIGRKGSVARVLGLSKSQQVFAAQPFKAPAPALLRPSSSRVRVGFDLVWNAPMSASLLFAMAGEPAGHSPLCETA